jgi:hypothetical protein
MLGLLSLAAASPLDSTATFKNIMKVHGTEVQPLVENEDATLTVVSFNLILVLSTLDEFQ